MDVKTYAVVTDVCARLAGRLDDGTLRAIRQDYACGEPVQAECTLVLNLAYEGVGITQEEHDLIRPTLDAAQLPDLENVQIIAEVPPVRYTFTDAPADAPDPAEADELLKREGHQLYRVWRDPDDGSEGVWLYVVLTPHGTDTMSVFSGLASTLWVELKLLWPIEVVAEGTPLPPYQAAALAACLTR